MRFLRHRLSVFDVDAPIGHVNHDQCGACLTERVAMHRPTRGDGQFALNSSPLEPAAVVTGPGEFIDQASWLINRLQTAEHLRSRNDPSVVVVFPDGSNARLLKVRKTDAGLLRV